MNFKLRFAYQTTYTFEKLAEFDVYAIQTLLREEKAQLIGEFVEYNGRQIAKVNETSTVTEWNLAS